MRKVVRYYVQFVCSNGRTRFCGEDWHMPYNRAAAELYSTAADCFERMDRIPQNYIMRHTTPEIKSRTVLIADVPEPRARFALPGLHNHAE